MTYLGRGRRGGGHICFWQSFSSSPSFYPKHVSLHLCLHSPQWWDVGQLFPPVNPTKPPSLWRKRIHLSRPSSHLSHPALLTNPVCAHRHVALGRGLSPEYGLNAKDHVHVSVSLSHTTVNMGWSNMCVWTARVLFRLVTVEEGFNLGHKYEGKLLSLMSIIKFCNVSGLIAPLVSKRAPAALPRLLIRKINHFNILYFRGIATFLS